MALRVRQNAALRALAPAQPRKLDRGLRALLGEGLAADAEYVLLARHAPTAPPARQSMFADAVAYEGNVNHVHVEREVATWRGRRNAAGHGVGYALELGRLLEREFPAREFDVWLRRGEDGWIARFHGCHAGFGSWLRRDDFEREIPSLVIEVRAG